MADDPTHQQQTVQDKYLDLLGGQMSGDLGQDDEADRLNKLVHLQKRIKRGEGDEEY